ncbi:MAG: hypothetical protein Q8R48_04855 [Candidatus Omnitrophota bacterium]|nr:hypothetical protein [Candidatus Omnitrophota bacterium]
MRGIFVFWIIFLVILIIGISLAISSRVTLKREEGRAAELRKSVISRPSRLPKQPAAPEAKTEVVQEAPKEITEVTPIPPAEPAPAVPSASSEGSASGGEIPPLGSDIPVQINTNSLEISIPPASQEELPAAGQ